MRAIDRVRRWGLLPTAVLLFPSLVQAAIFTVSGGSNQFRGGCGRVDAPLLGGGVDDYAVSSDVPVSDGVSGSAVGLTSSYACQFDLGGSANRGSVGSSAGFDVNHEVSVGYTAFAEARFDDFVLESNVRNDGEQVTTRILLDADGELDAFALGLVSTAIAEIQLTVQGPGVSFSDVWEYSATATQTNQNASAFVSEVLASREFEAILGAPYQVTLRVFNNVAVAPSGQRNGMGSVSSAFGQTLSFHQDGPVFELPEDVTVDAPSANVFDNAWVPVPEPSAPLALALGACALARVRRARCLQAPAIRMRAVFGET